MWRLEGGLFPLVEPCQMPCKSLFPADANLGHDQVAFRGFWVKQSGSSGDGFQGSDARLHGGGRVAGLPHPESEG